MDFTGRGTSKSKYVEAEKHRKYFRNSKTCVYRDIFS